MAKTFKTRLGLILKIVFGKNSPVTRIIRVEIKPEDEYTVYEVEETDTDEEADLLNFDDLDSDEFV